MNVFAQLQDHGHEQVVYCREESCGLRAIIAIHDTTLGPALGGTRMWDYATEEDALKDVLRLSKGMTYKASAAGLNLGGGKAVIMGDPKKLKSEALFRAFGRFVGSLGGRYITAEDVNTSVQDMEWIASETKYVTGITTLRGGSGDPSPVTAFGIYKGIQATIQERFGKKHVDGLKVAVQGLGKVGYYLAKHLIQDEKATVFGCDIDKDRQAAAAEELGVKIVSPEEIFDLDVHIFAPCALGAIINDKTIPRLRCQVVAGGANNQLEEGRHGDALAAKGILYAPDFVINAGGLINVYCEIDGYNRDRAMRIAGDIGASLHKIYTIAKEEKIATHRAAERLAERRIDSIRKLRRL